MNKKPNVRYLFERSAPSEPPTSDEAATQSTVKDYQQEEVNQELSERFSRNDRKKGKGPQVDYDEAAIPNAGFRPNRVIEYAKLQYMDAKADEGDWLSRPEIPTASEVLAFAENMPENIINDAWPSIQSYLSSHYNFLRSEAVRPLSEAIKVVRALSPTGIFENAIDRRDNGSGIGIYTKVQFRGLTFSKRGIGCRVSFSLDAVGKNVKWDQSKRLITGSLIALIPKDTTPRWRCIIAIVAARPLDNLHLNPPEIDIFLADGCDTEVDINTQWIMVEARSSFFEAQRHNMLTLQKMSNESFPLAHHLVELDSDVTSPPYVQQSPVYNLQSIFTPTSSTDPRYKAFKNVDVVHDWPTGVESTLDDSQQKALHTILSKQLAIIQGPPGTGKTKVSVAALECILKNTLDMSPPIIISCQTNHALDQILRYIYRICPDFVRLGGRSKDTTGKIQSRTLFNLTSKVRGSRYHTRGPTAIMQRLENSMREHLGPLCNDKALLDPSIYLKWGFLTKTQCDSLDGGNPHFETDLGSDDTPLQGWLGGDLLPNQVHGITERYGRDDDEDVAREELEELEAEGKAADAEDDIERLRGNQLVFTIGYIGKPSHLSDHEVENLLKNQNMWDIRKRSRSAVFNWLQRRVRECIRDKIWPIAVEYNKAARDQKYGRFENDLPLLRQQKVIGMTTTGLSKYRALIASLEPQIVLIEEAAESLEAPIIAACMESVQQLILVGDHKQLQPNCVLQASEERSWNISLFERLVTNGLPHRSLSTQRRMKPEIRRILYPIYKDLLTDHESMKDPAIRPSVPGMGGVDCFFFTHHWLDARNDNMSTINYDEADMLVGFVDYLLKNGVKKQQITILTFYNGQRSVILNKLLRHPDLVAMHRGPNQSTKPWQVFTVDSYQGEENDVVLLSCVRSNAEGQIGFLKKDNRVCVALSRAKSGFYIFGNAENLACESRTWSQVVTILTGHGTLGLINRPEIQPRRIGFHLPICCTTHQRTEFLGDSLGWTDINGGCRIKCKEPLECGHICPLNCHPFDLEHNHIACIMPCSRILPCRHACSRLCGEIPCHCSDCDRKYHADAIADADGDANEFPALPSGGKDGHGDRGGSNVWQDFSKGGYIEHDRQQAQNAKQKGRRR